MLLTTLGGCKSTRMKQYQWCCVRPWALGTGRSFLRAVATYAYSGTVPQSTQHSQVAICDTDDKICAEIIPIESADEQ